MDQAAAKPLLYGHLGLIQETLDGGVSHGQSDDAACRQGVQQLGQPPTVVVKFVRVVALGEEHGGRVLVHHAQVDASAEVPLEEVAAGGQTGDWDTSGQQRPGNSLCTVQLQGPSPHDAYELAAESRHLRDGFVVRAAHQGDGSMGAVATLGRTDVQGCTVFDENVMRSHGDVFGAVRTVCKYHLS